MKTRMNIFRVGQPIEVREIEFEERQHLEPGDAGPGYVQLKAVIEPLLDGDPMEHVSVLWEGKRADMFVSELGHVPLTTRLPLQCNDAATAIYRANWLKHHPGTDPESLHWIAGTAVLFDDLVWF